MSKKTTIKKVLISQPEPQHDHSPYHELAKKYGVELCFRPFIQVEGIPAREFRKQRVNPGDCTGVIFTSRNAITHYFRCCQEMRVEVGPEMKYYCITESIAVYLQKFIEYRKRKVFFPKGNNDFNGLLVKHKKEKFMYPCSDKHTDELPGFLRQNDIDFLEAVMFRTVSSDLSDLRAGDYDIIAFYSPSGIESLFANFPDFRQNGTRIAAFGHTTWEAVESKGLELNIKVPQPDAPSMTMALDHFLKSQLG